MKKVLLVVSLISVLLLAGCDKNVEFDNNVNDNIPEVIVDNQEQDINNIETFEKESEQYKLSDSIFLSDSNDAIENNNFFNVALLNMDNNGFKISQEEYKFTSNGEEHIIECKYYDSAIDVVVDGKPCRYQYGGIVGVAIIDMDENDDQKEIVLQYSQDNFRLNRVFIFDEENNLIDTEHFVRKVKDKFIDPMFEDSLGQKEGVPVLGYYIYEDGEFKLIDRLLTGEQLRNEDGLFISEISDLVVDCGVRGDSTVCYNYYDNDIKLLGEYRINIVNRKEANEEGKPRWIYDIRLLDDAKYGPDETVLPSGTILSDMLVDNYWD